MAIVLEFIHSLSSENPWCPTHRNNKPSFPANVLNILGFFPLHCVEYSNADHPPTSRIFKASTFPRQDTNTPLDLHHCLQH